jgi:hypothetical protein
MILGQPELNIMEMFEKYRFREIFMAPCLTSSLASLG